MSDLQMLPTWLDAGATALAGAVPPAQTLAEALPGLSLAQSLTPLQRLQRVQESGLAECEAAHYSSAQAPVDADRIRQAIDLVRQVDRRART